MTTHAIHHARSARLRAAVLTLLAALGLAACGSTDDGAEPAANGGGGDEPVVAASDPASDIVADPAAGPGGEVGSAVVRVDGVEYSDFEGECDISRGYGAEDVGQLSTPGFEVLVGIDNVEAHPDAQMSLTVFGEESFDLRDLVNRPDTTGLADSGTLDSISEIGDRVSEGTRDHVMVRFAGTLDDGTYVEADVHCELQNAY